MKQFSNMFSKAEQDKLREEFRDLMVDVWGDDKHMVDYCTKEADVFIRTSQGYILSLERPRIKTNFCFGYHDYVDGDYERANNMACHAEEDFNYFRSQNLEEIEGYIKWLSEEINDYNRLFFQNAYCSQTKDILKRVTSFRRCDDPQDVFTEEYKIYKPVPEVDRKLLIEAYEFEKERFSKRIETYLKRYGLSKVRSWSYWADE